MGYLGLSLLVLEVCPPPKPENESLCNPIQLTLNTTRSDYTAVGFQRMLYWDEG